MAGFDPSKLLENMDPAFRQAEAQQFAELLRLASMDETTDDRRIEYYDKAMRLLAAAVYMIARDLNLPPSDICVVATYTIGMFAGTSCQEGPETASQIKRLFAASFDDANSDKARAAGLMAEIVGDGIDIIRRLGSR